MAVISHCGVDYTAPTVEVQSDASATSLEATKVPTGQTITSYLNSKLNYKSIFNPSLVSNGTYNLTNSLSGIKELVIYLASNVAGAPYAPRATYVCPVGLIDSISTSGSACFVDFTWGGNVRNYLRITKVSDTQIKISDIGGNNTSYSWSTNVYLGIWGR